MKKKFCPECGNETVVENIVTIWFNQKETTPTERCTGLIEVDPNKPLEACLWSQELEDISMKQQ